MNEMKIDEVTNGANKPAVAVSELHFYGVAVVELNNTRQGISSVNHQMYDLNFGVNSTYGAIEVPVPVYVREMVFFV